MTPDGPVEPDTARAELRKTRLAPRLDRASDTERTDRHVERVAGKAVLAALADSLRATAYFGPLVYAGAARQRLDDLGLWSELDVGASRVGRCQP